MLDITATWDATCFDSGKLSLAGATGKFCTIAIFFKIRKHATTGKIISIFMTTFFLVSKYRYLDLKLLNVQVGFKFL
jgi:hypothetical protein